MSDATFAQLAQRGAVGLLRPSYGPTTNRRRALAELVRGTEVNARLGGVPAGKPLINTNKASVYPNCKVVHRRPVAAARQADLERPALPHRGHRQRLPWAAHVADHAHSRPRLDRGHRADRCCRDTRRRRSPGRRPRADASLGQLSKLDRAIGANNRLKFAALFILAGLLLTLALLGLRAAITAIPAALLVNLALGMTPGLERGAAVCRALRGNGAPGVRPRALLPQRLGAPRALRRRGRALRLRDGHAAGVAGGEPVRADAELAVLGDRQSDRDAAARAAPRGGVPRAKALRDRGLRRVRRLRARRDDGQPARLRRRWCDRARHCARGAGGAPVQARLCRASSACSPPRRSPCSGSSRRGSPTRARTTCAARSPTTAPGCSRRSRAGCRSRTCPRCTPGRSSFLSCSCSRSPLRSRGASRVQQSTRDILLAFGVAIVTSLLVNDSAAYELTAGIAVIGALARFAPAPAPARAPVLVPAIARLLVRARPRPEPVPVPVSTESPPG